MKELFKNKKILVVVAHPDDEILGLGASMHRLINEQGSKVRVVILGEGITSRSNNRNPKEWKKELLTHKKNIESARKAIGYKSVGVYDFPDNRFDTVALLDIIKVIEKEKEDFKPEIIFTHHGGDVNIDHQRTFEAVITCTRPMENELVKTLITFETPSGTEWRSPTDPKHFLPNFYISISEKNLKHKIDAMESYFYERRKYPHPRSPESLEIISKRWGTVIGVEYAEAFCIVRALAL